MKEHLPTIVTSIISILALWVAYLTLLKNSQPQILVYYRPNPNIPSFIDLVIENIGEGIAFNVNLSKPLPICAFGIGEPNCEPELTPQTGFPAISAKQQYIFDGGQYGGLKNELGDGLNTTVTYSYRTPIGFTIKSSESFFISIEHLRNIPTRISAEQAIIEALKGTNKTTLQKICSQLEDINKTLKKLVN